MRALFFILVGIALTFGAIHYMGPERFMKLYQGIMSTGSEIAGGGGIDTITDKLNAGGQNSPEPGGTTVVTPSSGGTGNAPASGTPAGP